MKANKYFATILAVLLFFTSVSIVSAQYDHLITDPEADVNYVNEEEETWLYENERPNIDILRAEISSEGEILTISLTVKGSITDNSSFKYAIWLADSEEGEYGILYTDGTCEMVLDISEGQMKREPETSGVGTSILNINIELDEIYNPTTLEITEVITYERIEGDKIKYWDKAYPDDDQDGTSDNGDSDGGGDQTTIGSPAIWIGFTIGAIFSILLISRKFKYNTV
jgi:hypothetical protein